MTRDEAETLVFDLLDAARYFDRAERFRRNDARKDYEEMRDKVITALCSHQQIMPEGKCKDL